MKKLGFTLIELIIVVAIIALLAAATFVAVDPAKRIGEANDASRWSDVTSVLNAILTYTVDVNALPTAVTNLTVGANHWLDSVAPVTAAGGANGCGSAGVAFAGDLVDKYIATIPTDPTYTGNTSTGYYIRRSAADRIAIGSCAKDYDGNTIEVSR